MKNAAFQMVDDVFVTVHGAEPPTDAEWDASLELLAKEVPRGKTRTLVVTAGGAPNALQRARLAKTTGKAEAFVAVLTDSRVARTVGTALQWVMPKFRIFGPREMDAALDHLGVQEEMRPRIRAAVAALTVQVTTR